MSIYKKLNPILFASLAKHSQRSIEFQQLCNHRHILEDLFASAEDANVMSLKQVEFIGKTLLDIWGMKLRTQFPHLNIQLELQENEDFDYILTFWAEPENA